MSTECRNLISRLLQFDPVKRIALHSIISHPFFNPALPTQSLDSAAMTRADINDASLLKKQHTEAKSSQSKPPSIPPFPAKASFARNRGRHSETVGIGRRKLLSEIVNKDLRRLLGHEISVSRIGLPGSTKRITSDPLPRNPVSSTSGLPALTARRDASFISPSSSESTYSRKDAGPLKTPKTNQASSFLPLAYGKYSERTKASPSSHTSDSPLVLEQEAADANAECFPDFPVAFTNAATGVTFPSPFATCLLKPQVHKTVHGQLTILPSRSLLVDFREGERRRGKKGDEVFVVDPSGKEVKVYSAPHLSTPCCLAEAVAVYSTDKLPSLYWQSYNDAKHLIEQIKQRTPMMVMYTTDARCTLMSNTPQADIELLFQQTERNLSRDSSAKGTKTTQTPHANMRIRLSRRKRSVEIARYVPGPWGGEWTKKVLLATDRGVGIRESDSRSLHVLERDGVKHLAEFLNVCEAVECLGVAGNNPVDAKKMVSSLEGRIRAAPAVSALDTHEENAQDQATTKAKPPRPSKLSMTNSLRSVNVAPRPGKLSQRGERIEPNPRKPDDLALVDKSLARFQTRFIPALGWCIHYSPKTSRGGSYRMMFLDGVTLDVDVDEGYVEFKEQSGNISRHSILDCKSKQKIWERMKVFDEFVSLFECSSDE